MNRPVKRARPVKRKRPPMQPISVHDDGVVRFQANTLVQYILDHGGIDLNDLAVAAHLHKFPRGDQEQFAQLIGYSTSSFGDLSYARSKTVARADAKARQVWEEHQKTKKAQARLAREVDRER